MLVVYFAKGLVSNNFTAATVILLPNKSFSYTNITVLSQKNYNGIY